MNNFKPDNGGGGVQVEGVLPPSAVVPMPRKMRSWLWLLVIFLPLGIIATVGFHVNFGQTPFFAQQIVLGTETVAGDAALSIDATMISSSLTITTHNSNEITISHNRGRPVQYNFSRANMHLEIAENLRNVGDRITIALPAWMEIGDLTATTLSGNITITDHIDAQWVYLRSASGNIRINSATAEDITATSISGNIRTDNLDTNGDTRLQSVSGNINLRDSDIGGHLSTTTTSGNINIRNTTNEMGQATLRSVSGRVNVR